MTHNDSAFLLKVHVRSLRTVAAELRAGRLPPSPPLAAALLERCADLIERGDASVEKLTQERDEARQIARKLSTAYDALHVAYPVVTEQARITETIDRWDAESRIRDYGPGECEVDGCTNPRHFFPNSKHHAPVCATHAWERIKAGCA